MTREIELKGTRRMLAPILLCLMLSSDLGAERASAAELLEESFWEQQTLEGAVQQMSEAESVTLPAAPPIDSTSSADSIAPPALEPLVTETCDSVDFPEFTDADSILDIVEPARMPTLDDFWDSAISVERMALYESYADYLTLESTDVGNAIQELADAVHSLSSEAQYSGPQEVSEDSQLDSYYSKPDQLDPAFNLKVESRFDYAKRVCGDNIRCVLVFDKCKRTDASQDFRLCGSPIPVSHGESVRSMFHTAGGGANSFCVDISEIREWVTAVRKGDLKVVAANLSIGESKTMRMEAFKNAGVDFSRQILGDPQLRDKIFKKYVEHIKSDDALRIVFLQSVLDVATSLSDLVSMKIPVFIAAGNDGPDALSIQALPFHKPAAAPYIKLVGASYQDSWLTRPALFSSTLPGVVYSTGLYGLFNDEFGYLVHPSSPANFLGYFDTKTSAQAPAPKVFTEYAGKKPQPIALTCDLKKCLNGIGELTLEQKEGGRIVRSAEQVAHEKQMFLLRWTATCVAALGKVGLYDFHSLLKTASSNSSLINPLLYYKGEYLALDRANINNKAQSPIIAFYRLMPPGNDRLIVAPGGLMMPGQTCQAEGTSYAAPTAMYEYVSSLQ